MIANLWRQEKAIEISIKLKLTFDQNKIHIVTIRNVSNSDAIIRTTTITDKQKAEILNKLNEKGLNVKEKSFDTLGPVIGSETRENALKAVAIAVIAITLYIAFACQ